MYVRFQASPKERHLIIVKIEVFEVYQMLDCGVLKVHNLSLLDILIRII